MGYSLTIGEAAIENHSNGHIKLTAERVEEDHFPAYGDPTDNTNTRWPSYGSWHDAMEILGLKDIMFQEEYECEDGTFIRGLIADHPGVTMITEKHMKIVSDAMNAYRAKHTTHRSEWPPLQEGAVPYGNSDVYAEADYVDDPTYDTALVRGEWLEYCMKWALENCVIPVFVNT